MTKKRLKFKVGENPLPMLTSIGEAILRECVKESDLAIETSQRLGGEVRTKALGTIGVLSTFVLALFVATYSIPKMGGVLYSELILLMVILGYGIMHLFGGIIYNKKNQNGGSTLSYLLNQDTLDGLTKTKDEKERICLFLFYEINRKETTCDAIDSETINKQQCYKRVMRVVSLSTIIIIIFYALVFGLFQA